MARGYPAIWSTILSLPFIGAGGYLFLMQQRDLQIPNVTISQSEFQLLGIPIAGFGVFIFLVGLYVQFVSPPEPSLQENEEMIDSRTPSQRVALSKILIGLPILAAGGFVLFFTFLPYVYPTLILITGLYFFSSGVKTYWANTLTSFYITTKRVIREYRFVALRRQEIPLTKVRGVEERKSITEALVGLGNIRIASGGGGGSVQIVINNISDSTEFANRIRGLIS